MKKLLAIIAITFLIACGPDPEPDRNETTKNYNVTVNNGVSCSVMIRKGSYSDHKYTLQCPSGTKIYCMRVYDNSNFILGTESAYGSFGLVAADGYGDGQIFINSNNGNFESIVRVSLHETSCN